MKHTTEHAIVHVLFCALLVAIIAGPSSGVTAQESKGHLILKDSSGVTVNAIFRTSERHASNDLMVLDDRCIEIFDLDGEHLHWAPYDLVSGAIAYYPSPCMPDPPEFYFNDLCTMGLADPGDKVAFFHVGHQTVSRSSVSVTYALTTAYSLKSGTCQPVTFAYPRDLVSTRPMTDTSPWPVSLPGKKPFHVEVVYE